MENILQHDVIFFDLDYTLIDSSKRYKACIDDQRNLNVMAYRATQSHSIIRGDTRTPLVKLYRAVPEHKRYAITARRMESPDYHWLDRKGLYFKRIFSRDTVASWKARDGKPDGLYKRDILKPLLNLNGFKGKSIALIDDNPSVLHEAEKLGIISYNSIDLIRSINPLYTFKAGL